MMLLTGIMAFDGVAADINLLIQGGRFKWDVNDIKEIHHNKNDKTMTVELNNGESLDFDIETVREVIMNDKRMTSILDAFGEIESVINNADGPEEIANGLDKLIESSEFLREWEIADNNYKVSHTYRFLSLYGEFIC